MDESDVIALLGQPDQIFAPGTGPRMVSRAWFCSTCCKLHRFPEPVGPPAPCECGGIAFEKRS